MKVLLQQALEAATDLAEYQHAEYTEALSFWGEGNPHRWTRLATQTLETRLLMDKLREAIAAPEPVTVAWIIEGTEMDMEGKLTHQRDIDYYPEKIETLPIGTTLYAKEQS